MPFIMIGLTGSARVSPVRVLLSFVRTPMSPALSSETLSCFLPIGIDTTLMRSSSSLLMFSSFVSGVSEPVMTLRYVILPTNGSAVVLKTSAENGWDGSVFTFISCSVFASLADSGCAWSGDGSSRLLHQRHFRSNIGE